jgi:hypothetical protein
MRISPRGKGDSMTITRKPVAFGDLRGWLKALEAAGELHQI